MHYKLIISLFFCLFTGCLLAQQPETKHIRIADTLTAQEKISRNTVILKSELDSLIQVYNNNLPKTIPQEPLQKSENRLSEYLLWMAIALLLGITVLLYILFRNQKKFNQTVSSLNRQIQHLEFAAISASSNEFGAGTKLKGKASVTGLEKKIQLLTQQLDKATKDNQELEQLVKEYTNSKQDFEMVKQQMMEVYKIRNYPGFTKDKSETEIVKSLLDTERAVALYAYEHFLKPVLAIADANKNNPAKINPEEREQMLNLLISLSLLYSEYLYLRINDLSVGGKIVQRIGSLRNGNSIDPTLLKELNIEHGSRALVLRMVLDKTAIQHLSYPVFDETNLNLS
ncbi:MAG: hypothetical protein ABI675_24365 [Chitinophagaceae bacterium]